MVSVRSAPRRGDASRPFPTGPATRTLRLLVASGLLVMASVGCGDEEASRSTSVPGVLVDLDKAFQPLRTDFEGEVGTVRLVGVVAPTCGRCLDAVKSVYEEIMPQVESEDFRVIIVWAGLMPTDVRLRAEQLAEQHSGPRIRHYWEDSGRIARVIGQVFGVEPGKSVYDVFLLYGRNDTWDPEGTMSDEPPDQNALVAGWTPPPPRYRMGEHDLVRIPRFNVVETVAQIRDLLAEPVEAVSGPAGQGRP